MTATYRYIWSEEDTKKVLALRLGGRSVPFISDVMDRPVVEVEALIERLRKAKLLPKKGLTPVGAEAPPISFQDKPHYSPRAEAAMLQQVNTAGGFPILRTVEIRGQKIAVWTTPNGQDLHPFYRTKAFTPPQQRAA